MILIGSPKDSPNGSNSGSGYVFVESGDSWSQQAKLTPTDGRAGDQFGMAVAISGDYAIVGTPYSDSGATDSGAAYIFVRSGDSWSQQAKLTPTDGRQADQFGTAVAISDLHALIGVPYSDFGFTDSGAAYVFVRSDDSWSQQAKLTPTDGRQADQFGMSVSIYSHYALVGSPYSDSGATDAGATYVFNAGPQ